MGSSLISKLPFIQIIMTELTYTIMDMLYDEQLAIFHTTEKLSVIVDDCRLGWHILSPDGYCSDVTKTWCYVCIRECVLYFTTGLTVTSKPFHYSQLYSVISGKLSGVVWFCPLLQTCLQPVQEWVGIQHTFDLFYCIPTYPLLIMEGTYMYVHLKLENIHLKYVNK